jgi:hypothetical protein
MYGTLMDFPNSPANEIPASLLDVMMMVSHGGRVETAEIPGGDPSIGCLSDIAAIP